MTSLFANVIENILGKVVIRKYAKTTAIKMGYVSKENVDVIQVGKELTVL